MANPRLDYLTAQEREFIHEQTVRVLAEVGVGYGSPEAIELLEDAGAEVDHETLRAKVPWELVELCLGTCPRQVRLAARDPRHDVTLGDGSLLFCSDGTGTFMYDDVSGRRTEGTAADQRRTMRLLDALPEIDYGWPPISARDLDPRTAGLEIEAISLRSFSKHLQDEVREVAHVAPLLDIFTAVAGDSLWRRPVFSTINCTVAPLTHERDMTEATMRLVKAGVPVLILPMALTGTTGPMTVLGSCIVNMAELLSAVVLFQLAQPGCGLISGVGTAVADLRSGAYLCGTPEVGLINAICIEMSRHYGLPVTGSAFSGDAKGTDYQAGAEGVMTAVACALAGADSLLSFGLMDGAETVSLAKIVLDCDAVGMIERFMRPATIDATTALLDDIAAVGPGGHYLGRRSTRDWHRRGEVWWPRTFRRDSWAACEGRPRLREAADRARELIETHEVPPLPDDVDRHIDAVIEDYRRLVLG